MAENLATSRFKNGDYISPIIENKQWSQWHLPAWTFYPYEKGPNPAGKLYNYYAVIDARGICPVDWHTPTDAEFGTLNTTIGGNGGTLKEAGLLHWDSPNSGATNTTDFSALGAGYMGTSAPSLQRNVTYFWTASSYDATRAYTWSLSKDNTSFTQSNANTKVGGFSVRCIKN
jgi:uncharacterized protein (TIGR02145 family)